MSVCFFYMKWHESCHYCIKERSIYLVNKAGPTRLAKEKESETKMNKKEKEKYIVIAEAELSCLQYAIQVSWRKGDIQKPKPLRQ